MDILSKRDKDIIDVLRQFWYDVVPGLASVAILGYWLLTKGN